MQAEEFRLFLSRFAKLNGKELDDEQQHAICMQFEGVTGEGDGVITEQEFVDHFISEMMNTSDFDFHVTVKFFYAGTMNYY